MLLIAPQTNLEFPAVEVQNVANALRPRLLIGNVTLAQVVEELGRAEYKVVWFATHGDAEGILLSDGKLTPEQLAQVLRPCPPRLLFLNTCSSFNVAMVVHDSVNTAVVGTICDLPDRDAFVTGSVLARVIERQLANGGDLDVNAAYQESKPGQNRQYILLNGAVRLGNEDKQDDLLQMMLYVMKRQDEIEAAISRETERLRQEMSSRYQRKATRQQTTGWMLAYVVFIGAALLFNADVTGRLGLRWPVAFVIVALIDTMTAALFIWATGLPWPWNTKEGGE